MNIVQGSYTFSNQTLKDFPGHLLDILSFYFVLLFYPLDIFIYFLVLLILSLKFQRLFLESAPGRM